MSQTQVPAQKCPNQCKDGFTLFQSKQDTADLVKKFPFFRVIGGGTCIVGGTKKEYSLIKCDRLGGDGCCKNHPQKEPLWCQDMPL